MKTTDEAKETGADKLVNFINNRRKTILGIGIAIVIIIAGLGLADYLGNKKKTEAVLLSEKIMKAYGEWVSADDESKEAKEKELTELFEQDNSKYAGTYAEMRELYTEAMFASSKGDQKGAAEKFYTFYEKFPQSYMGSTALLNSAYAFESAGMIDESLANFELLINTYDKKSFNSFYIPEALFNLGRLSADNQEQAKEYFNQILSDYESSPWVNLAKSEIIKINIQ